MLPSSFLPNVVRPCCREAAWAAFRGARHAKRGGRRSAPGKIFNLNFFEMGHNVRQALLGRFGFDKRGRDQGRASRDRLGNVESVARFTKFNIFTTD